MMSKFLHIIKILLAICFITWVSTPSAFAASSTAQQPYVDDSTEINNTLSTNALFRQANMATHLPACTRNVPADLAANGMTDAQWREKYSSRFTYCMRVMLEEITDTILGGLKTYVRPAMYSIIFLATVIMGMKAIGGMFRNVKAETAVFIMRVGLVIFAFENMEEVASLFFNLTDEILTTLGKGAAATFTATGGGAFHCQPSVSGANYGQYEWIKVYDWIDCLIKKIFGLGTRKETIISLAAVAGASIFTGTSGAHVGMIMIGFIISITLFLLRVTTMMVMAYGAIAMIMIMFPIFLLTVFFKVTESYFFNRWLSMIVRNMVQPAIVIGFMYFGVAALDNIIYKGSTGKSSYYSFSQPIKTEHDPYGLRTPIITRDGPASGYSQVVEPIFNIFGVNHTDPIDVQVETMRNLLGQEKKLINIQDYLGDNTRFYGFFEAQCGDAGLLNVSKAAARAAVIAYFRNKRDRIKDWVDWSSPESDATMDEIDKGFEPGAGPDAQRWSFELICSAGRFMMTSRAGKWGISKLSDAYVPTIHTIDFTKHKDSPGTGSPPDPEKFHEKMMGKLLIALVALSVLGGTLYSFTNEIEALARTIVGKLGFSLSILSGSEGSNSSLGKKIQTGLIGLEQNWKKAVDNKSGKGR